MAGVEIFHRVQTERASAQIVEQVRTAIYAGDIKVGDRLPPEREMAELFRVSRVTVRDALRILEARGLVTIRVGAQGGAFVTAPVGTLVGDGLIDMIAMSQLSAQSVTETRQLLEVGAVPLICERATADDFEALEGMCVKGRRSVQDGNYDMEMSAEFHLALVRASHNQSLVLLMEVLQHPLLNSLKEARQSAPHMGIRGVEEHYEIVKRLKAGDADGARTLMTEHLGRTASRLLEAYEVRTV